MINSGNQSQRDAVSHSKAIDVLCVVIPVARGHANRAGRVRTRKARSSSHQPIHREFPKGSDRIEPLLVGHDEQNVRPGHMSFGAKRRSPDYSYAHEHAIKREMFRLAQHDSAIDDASSYASANSLPVKRRNASTYLAELFSITSLGRRGAGGVLSQSRVSR